jgi:hypothetical protein
MFYDELNSEVDKSDIELIYKDDTYSYYRVYTYKGIMKIGSPAWCLKTKSNWDSYQSKYDQQWVVIENSYKKNLITPDNNYLQSYSNVKKPWIRYGVSVKINDDNTINWIGNDDNNGILKGNPDSFTSFGIICTIFNLIKGKKISYYDRFIGCENINNNSWHKVINKESFFSWMRLDDKMFISSEIYVRFSKNYEFLSPLLIFKDSSITIFLPSKNVNISPTSLKSEHIKKIIIDYVKRSDSIYFYGIKLANNLMTMEDIQNENKFVTKFGKWLIFENSERHYIIVNGEYNDNVDFPISNSIFESIIDFNNPVAWYIDKKNMKPVFQKFNENLSTYVPIKEYHTEVIEFLKKNYPSTIEENPKEEKKVKGFFDFLKRKKS